VSFKMKVEFEDGRLPSRSVGGNGVGSGNTWSPWSDSAWCDPRVRRPQGRKVRIFTVQLAVSFKVSMRVSAAPGGKSHFKHSLKCLS